jgi:hypothetical protein
MLTAGQGPRGERPGGEGSVPQLRIRIGKEMLIITRKIGDEDEDDDKSG